MTAFLLAAVAAAVIGGGLDRNIVTTEWLERHLGDPYVVVVEVGPHAAAAHPHIPGARFIDIDAIVQRAGWPPDELPPTDQLRRAFGEAGIGDDGRIIIYSTSPVYAARAWFTLDYLGQGHRASILDGGLQQWKAEKRPLATARVRPIPRTFTAYPNPSRLAALDEVRAAVSAGDLVIDARPSREFEGYRRGAQVARPGHIPGALCAPWKTNYTRNGTFLPPTVLRARYDEMIRNPDERVIVYCRTGMDAAVPYFILRSLGYEVALHDGGFTEWSRVRALPVAKLWPMR